MSYHRNTTSPLVPELIGIGNGSMAKPGSARAAAFRQCATINREMAATIGAIPGSSIWAALEACAERMDEIAANEPTYGGIPISDHAQSSGLAGWHPGDEA